jgi:multiple sugar transport system substrate-binding protein
MADTRLEKRGRHRRAMPSLFLAALVAALLVGITGAEAQKLTVWSGYPELEPFYRHVADGMKAKFPSLAVSVEAIPLREHEKRVALALASGGNGALVLELSTADATRYLNNDLLPKAPADVAAFVGNAANFNSFFRDSASLGGAVYGVPLFHGQVSLFYNLDMFKAAGLAQPPTTMDEYNAYAEKLTQRDASGKATVSGWSMRLSGGGQGVAEKFWINMFQYGGNILSKTSDAKWRVTLASEAGRKALKQYLVNVHKTKTVSPEMPADAEAFERQEGAKTQLRHRAAAARLDERAGQSLCQRQGSREGRRGRGRLGLHFGRRRTGQSDLDAEECRLAAEPRGYRLFGGHRSGAGLRRVRREPQEP